MNTHKIKQLSSGLINQIAAGEVVARPASAFKECMENSLDANAKKIEVNLQDGGLKLIEIRDDGVGIAQQDLELAITRHATSKIENLADLEQVGSFGFRGEALAAISAVSHFELISAQAQKTAWRLAFNPANGDCKIIEHAHPEGTSVIIRDIFFNLPARRKFLRSARTEFNHIEKNFRALALAFADINFKLNHNDKNIWNLNATDFTSRCRQIMGKEFTEKSFWVDSVSGAWRLYGYVGSPHLAKNASDSQYFFVNRRAVSDRVISHAIKQAYGDIMYGNKQPVFVLFLDIPPEEVDVNVHPTKSEVRFRQANQLHSFIYSSLTKELTKPLATKTDNLTPSTIIATKNKVMNSSDNLAWHKRQADFNQSFFQINDNYSDLIAKNSVANVKPNSQNFFNEEQLLQVDTDSDPSQQSPFIDLQNPLTKATTTPNSSEELLLPLEPNATNADISTTPPQQMQFNNPSMQIPPMGFAVAQIKNIFILSETANGLLIVDMHAAHERIIYEDMKLELQNSNLNNQKLLFPLELKVDDSLLETAELHKDFLQNLGLELQPVDGILTIHSFPSVLQQEHALLMVEEVLQELHNYASGISWQLAMERCLTSMACRGAWRSGKKLSMQQMNYLLRRMETTPNSDTCCHGRLTWKEFDLKELNAFFNRGR